MKVDLTALRALQDQGYLECRKHPTRDLLLWDYSRKCQWDKHWTPETLMCRGLVTDLDGNIKLRALPKFFNAFELLLTEIPLHESFEVYEKIDGSMLLAGIVDGELLCCTRGSFVSEQAAKGEEILRRAWGGAIPLVPGYSYVLEVIYPENRIVVDYGGAEKCVLLAVLDTETGEELPLVNVDIGVEKPRKYEFARFEDIVTDGFNNREGYVVRFASGFRVKKKFGEYVRLHRLVTGTTPRRVWEALSEGNGLKTFLQGVPEEFQAWVVSVATELQNAHDLVLSHARADYEKAKAAARPAFARAAQEAANPPILFKLWDGQDHDPLVWKLVRPASTRTFRVDEG